jgi:hypothetical protein
MLIHAMFAVLLIVAFTATILTQALVASKIALHATVARYLEAASGDAVADLTGGMQYYVKHAGAAGPWLVEGSESRSPRRPVCAETVASGECPFSYDISARVTGSTTGTAPGGGTDVALNLQSAVIDEQRVSAQVTVRLYARDSDKILGSRTRYLTYRVLNSAPYAIISGVRDGTTVNGLAASAQGDTSGTAALTIKNGTISDNPAPQVDSPDAYRDSTVQVRMICSTINDASRLQSPPGNENTPWGVSALGLEQPCQPDSSYDINAFQDRRPWQNGNAGSTGWTE